MYINIQFLDAIYYGVMGACSLLVGTIAASMGFISCFWFNRMIYSSIKID